LRQPGTPAICPPTLDSRKALYHSASETLHGLRWHAGCIYQHQETHRNESDRAFIKS
jgi:hypothetical protein